MKNGTLYGSRLKKAYAQLRAAGGKTEVPELDDPMRRLAIGILGVGWTERETQHAFDRAYNSMVDWNEMRVSSAAELNLATGNVIPNGLRRCRELLDALQAIYDRENRLSLDRLRSLGRREARQYLEQLEGVNEFAAASALLWGLGGHAVPVSDLLLAELRKAELVHPTATRAEVQAFLERHVSATDAREFCIVMRGFKAKTTSKKPAARSRSRRKRAGEKRVKSR